MSICHIDLYTITICVCLPSIIIRLKACVSLLYEWNLCQSVIDGNLCSYAIDPYTIATLCQSVVSSYLIVWCASTYPSGQSLDLKCPLFLLLSRCPHQQPDVRMLSAEAPRRTTPGWDQVLFLPGMSGRVHEAVRPRLPVRRVQLKVSVVPFQQIRRRRHEAQSRGWRLLRLLRVQVVYVFIVPYFGRCLVLIWIWGG